MIDTQSADLIARSVNARNARTTQRAEAAADLVVALVLAVLATMALLHWAAACNVMDSAALCTLAAVPTRCSPWRRLINSLRTWYLGVLIDAAERDAWFHDGTAIIAPQQAQLARQRAAELRVQLAELEAR